MEFIHIAIERHCRKTPIIGPGVLLLSVPLEMKTGGAVAIKDMITTAQIMPHSVVVMNNFLKSHASKMRKKKKK